jgi:DNA-binding Lrp family transcriptional regulator
MKLNKYLEFVSSDLEPVKSFRLKDDLNPKLWTDFEINEEVKEDLLKIASDFYSSTDLNADVKDYNWSEKYSDYDLHILINFKDVDDNVELVKKFVDSAKNIWNKDHDIRIKGYEVEVYIQDISEPHKSTGIFSLLKDKWIVRPEKVDVEPDEDMIKEKAKSIMMAIDDIEDEVDEDKYEAFIEKIDKVWNKVKDYRKSGLDSEGGEFSTGNFVFKLLRRNGYISKIMSLKKESYDKQFN